MERENGSPRLIFDAFDPGTRAVHQICLLGGFEPGCIQPKEGMRTIGETVRLERGANINSMSGQVASCSGEITRQLAVNQQLSGPVQLQSAGQVNRLQRVCKAEETCENVN